MYLLQYILLTLVIGYSFKVFIGLNYEKSVVIGQVIIIGFLYVFYLLDKLELGLWVVIGGIICSLAVALCVSIKRKMFIDNIRSVFGVSFYGYVLYLVAAFLTVRNKVPFWGDELRYWAAVPKILYYYHGALQLNDGFQLFSVDYIPGISVYQYFLEYINGAWSDSLLFFSYAAITGALILPIGGMIKKWYGAFALSGALYFVPLFFFHTRGNDYALVYQSLYVDPMVGVAAGVLVWLCLRKPWESKTDFAVYVSVGTFLALLKSSGIVFVIVASATMICYLIVSKELRVLKKAWLWIGILAPIVLWEFWNISLVYYDISKELNYSLVSFWDTSFIATFAEALLKKKILSVWLPPINDWFSFAVCFTVLTILLVILLKIINRTLMDDSKYRGVITGMLYIQAFIYVIGLYGLCAGTFGGQLNSYARYISSVLEMMFCFWFCELFVNWNQVVGFLYRKKHKLTWMLSVFVAVVLFILIAPLRHVNNTANTYGDYIIEDRLAVSSIFSNVFDEIPQDGWKSVSLVFDEPNWESEAWVSWAKQWYGHLLQNISYENIEYGIQVRQASYYTSELNIEYLENGGVICTLNNDREWADLDYICMLHGNYVETPIHNWELYRVSGREGKTLFLDLIAEDSKPEEFINYHV
ncbi:MAG: hypothetical protein J1E64_00570 [Acetatifactor sp.]|nr:hypothetical protein [Acetatifactor sp.]